MRIEPLLGEANCLVLRNEPDAAAVLTRVAEAAARVLGRESSADILVGLQAREAELPTSTPEGVAFPHTIIPDLPKAALIIAAVTPPVRLHAADTVPTSLVLCIVGSRDKPFEHVRLLARLARVVRSAESRANLSSSPDAATLLARAIAEDRSHG